MHVQKHFLVVTEHWEQLRPPVHPAEYRSRLASAEGGQSTLGEAAETYQACVRNYMGPANIDRAACVLEKINEDDGFQRRIAFVSNGGFLAVFVAEAVSEMLTAYRPVHRGWGGQPGINHFVAAARNKLASKVSQTAAWQRLFPSYRGIW